MRRFLSFNDFFKIYLSGKSVKLSLDGGFTCPNRDGNLSFEGCLFCSDFGSGDFTSSKKLSLEDQIEDQKIKLSKKWKAQNYIAYFQNFSNTYGDFSHLKNLYSYVINRDDIKALSIATRCDCLDDQKIELLKELSKEKLLWLEIGLQTTKNESLKLINRGYSHNKFNEVIEMLDKNKIKYVLHLIYGLPGEDKKDFANTFAYANSLKPFGIKFHNLYIQKNSPIYAYYLENPFNLLSMNEYIDLVIESLINLNDYTVVHRITGDPDIKTLYGPRWCGDKLKVISTIDKILKEKNIPILKDEDINKAVSYWKNY